jgi:hypothetical protein
MTAQSILKALEPHDPNSAVLSEILAINSALADLHVRVSRLAEMMATTAVVLPERESYGNVLAAVAKAMGSQSNPPAPSNRDVSTDGEASSGVAPQGEAPLAGTGSETLADHEGHCAKGAGEDESSAADLCSDPAPIIPLKHYVPQSPAFETVLDRYAETTITSAEIARQTGIKRSSVGAYLTMARKANDPRVLKGDAARRSEAPVADEPEEELKAEDIVETVIVQVDEPSEPVTPVPAERAGLSSIVFRRPPKVVDEDEGPARLRIPSVPAAPPKMMPVAPPAEEPKRTPVGDFDPGKIMVVDVEALKIHGPFGSVDVVRPFARSMERMVDGGTYDVDTLRDLGPWPRTDALKDHFSSMRRKLAAIGIDLVTVNKFMFRVRRLEA